MAHVIELDRIPEIPVEGKRLGRHLHHDSRSKAYAVKAEPRGALASVQHHRFAPVFDQGSLGSCTGNAAVGALGTGALYQAVSGIGLRFEEKLAVSVYSGATAIDSFAGTWEPDDTGSDGLSVAKVLKLNNWIAGYQHALSLDAALTALQTNAVITGVTWYEGFDEPSSTGRVVISGAERGGHEFVVDGIDVDNQRVWATNSWGTSYGEGGRFWMSWDTWGTLLENGGDATILVPATAPAPVPNPDVILTKDQQADLALATRLHKWLSGCPLRFPKVQTAARDWLATKDL